jgi:hypothetical protein
MCIIRIKDYQDAKTSFIKEFAVEDTMILRIEIVVGNFQNGFLAKMEKVFRKHGVEIFYHTGSCFSQGCIYEVYCKGCFERLTVDRFQRDVKCMKGVIHVSITPLATKEGKILEVEALEVETLENGLQRLEKDVNPS